MSSTQRMMLRLWMAPASIVSALWLASSLARHKQDWAISGRPTGWWSHACEWCMSAVAPALPLIVCAHLAIMFIPWKSFSELSENLIHIKTCEATQHMLPSCNTTVPVSWAVDTGCVEYFHEHHLSEKMSGWLIISFNLDSGSFRMSSWLSHLPKECKTSVPPKVMPALFFGGNDDWLLKKRTIYTHQIYNMWPTHTGR